MIIADNVSIDWKIARTNLVLDGANLATLQEAKMLI
jgi:hypothetical protein